MTPGMMAKVGCMYTVFERPTRRGRGHGRRNGKRRGQRPGHGHDRPDRVRAHGLRNSRDSVHVRYDIPFTRENFHHFWVRAAMREE